jgi:hypothetical protein
VRDREQCGSCGLNPASLENQTHSVTSTSMKPPTTRVR